MALSLMLLALALADGPQETMAAGEPVTDPAAATAVVSQSDFLPQGAPADDYQFTAWCHGVLSGHMALAERIQPVMPLDEVQQKIGKAYLRGYEEALGVADASKSPADRAEANRTREAARANWDKAMRAEMQLAADTYLAWQLPGRCEHAAKRISGRDDLFRMEPGVGDSEAMGRADVGAPVASGSAFAEAAPAAEVPAETPPAMDVPASEYFEPVVLADLPEVDLVPRLPEADVADEAALIEAGAAEVAAAPAAIPVAAPAAPAPAPAPAPAAEQPAPVEQAATARDDGAAEGVRMPRSGRLLPWGKRK